MGDSRAGASGKQAPHCAMLAMLRAGFVHPACRHSAMAMGGCQRGVARTAASVRLGFWGWREGRQEGAGCSLGQWALCLYPSPKSQGERRGWRWASSGFTAGQAFLCRGHAGGCGDRGSPAALACSLHAQKEGWGRDAGVCPYLWLSCPWTRSQSSEPSPNALPPHIPVVKEEKSLVLPWAREV